MDEKRVNDLQIARTAARQHGVVSTAQLAANGVSKDSITARVRSGRLHRIHRGVHAVGHAGLADEGRWMAAVLACGDGAVLSHRSAAVLWGMLGRQAGPVHVTVPTRGGRRARSGIRIHRSPHLPGAATARRHGIAVTTPQRTLEDLRRELAPGELRRAIREAEIAGLAVDARALAPDRASSHLELRFLAACRRHRLPPPDVNVRVGRFLVDFLWPGERLIVETDGVLLPSR